MFKLDLDTARLIRTVFLPRNPRKMRGTHPDVLRAVDAYLEALSVAELGDAVAEVERDHPLPRCRHGQTLRDAAGEKLEPPCGCRFIDTVHVLRSDFR